MIKTHCSLVVVFCLFVNTLFSNEVNWSSDPVRAEIDAYYVSANEVRDNNMKNPEVRKKWLLEWCARFQKIIEDNPESPYIASARSSLLGLYNGMGKFDDSQKLLEVIVNETDSPAKKSYYYNEMGEVARIQAIAGKSPEYAQKSFDAYEKGYNIYKTLDEKTRGRMQSDSQQIYALALAGSLASFFEGMEAKIPHYYEEARKIYQQSVDVAAHTESTGIGLESLLEGEMRGWVKCRNEDKSKEVLGAFSTLRNPRWDPSFYAKECADLLYEHKPIKYQEFVSDWLQKHPRDKRTAILMACLALSYYRTEQYMKALPILETLRNDYLQDFQREDADAFKQGRDGYYDLVMGDLMMIYLRRGEFDEARKVQQELKKHLPNSKNIKKLEQIEIIPDLVDMPSATETNNMVWYRIFGASVGSFGMLCIIFGLYLYFRNQK